MPYVPVTPLDRVVSALKQEWSAIEPGTKLPSVNALSERFSVSNGTIARAFDILRDEGLIVTRQGYGTFRA